MLSAKLLVFFLSFIQVHTRDEKKGFDILPMDLLLSEEGTEIPVINTDTDELDDLVTNGETEQNPQQTPIGVDANPQSNPAMLDQFYQTQTDEWMPDPGSQGVFGHGSETFQTGAAGSTATAASQTSHYGSSQSGLQRTDHVYNLSDLAQEEQSDDGSQIDSDSESDALETDEEESPAITGSEISHAASNRPSSPPNSQFFIQNYSSDEEDE